MICVLIPTCKRAALLRDALDSVRRQTARSAITQVIVSENSPNTESRTVCEEFADLPLTYLHQDPMALMHLKVMLEFVNAPMVALMHDDDWWAPDHLEVALSLLQSDPNCPAVFSSFYETRGPRYPGQILPHVWRVWVTSGRDFSKATLKLDADSVLLTSLLDATFHYSTLVGRSDAVRKAYFNMISLDNPFDNDRSFPIFLSDQGPLGYCTNPSAFIRRHELMDCLRPEYLGPKGVNLKNSTTRWLMQTRPEAVKRVVEKFNAIASELDEEILRLISASNHPDVHRVLVEECGLALVPPEADENRSKLSRFARLFCPPVLLSMKRKASKMISNGSKD